MAWWWGSGVSYKAGVGDSSPSAPTSRSLGLRIVAVRCHLQGLSAVDEAPRTTAAAMQPPRRRTRRSASAPFPFAASLRGEPALGHQGIVAAIHLVSVLHAPTEDLQLVVDNVDAVLEPEVGRGVEAHVLGPLRSEPAVAARVALSHISNV
jgi:hypothetical protein